MFTSLDEQMKYYDATAESLGQRVTKWAGTAFIAVVVFGGLYTALQAIA
jgi:hypothetical protein